jgi:hypothetical protein
MPRSHRLSNCSVAHEHRVHRDAKEALHQRGGIHIGADEIAEWTQHRPLSENAALIEESGSRRREPNALSLESFEGVQLGD